MNKIIYYVYSMILITALSCNEDMIQDGVDSSQDPRVPEINVKLVSESIPSGGSTDEIIGVKSGSSKEIIFTIENLGTADLELSGAPIVAVSSDNADEFPQSEIVQPPSVIAGGRSEPFTVVFAPQDSEPKTATITIMSNDADEPVYSFTIIGRSKPLPDFSARLRKASSPLSVIFEDRSLPNGEITSWKWDFDGDGIIDSFQQNPIHLYNDPGNYTVVLEVEGAGGTDYRIKSNYIQVENPEKHVITGNFSEAMWVGCADIDLDSDQDVMAGSGSNHELAWWSNVDIDGPGTGNASEWQKYSINDKVTLPLDFSSVHAADFDKVGGIDIAAIGDNSGEELYLFINNGTSYWNETGPIVIDYSNPICVADLNSDSELDILVSFPPKWLENDGDENFTANDLDLWPFPAGQSITQWYSAYLDNDSDKDIIGCYSSGIPANYSVCWWKNDGSQGFTEDHMLAGSSDHPYSLNIADLNNDGEIDIIISDPNNNSIYWWENDGNMNLTVHTVDNGMTGRYTLNTDDIEDDGDLDIIGAGYDNNEILWWENDGDQNFTRHIIATAFNGAKSISSADIDADGVKEIVGASFNDNELAWWEISISEWNENIVEGSFSGAFDVHAADMDDDGDLDLVGAGDDGITWWEFDEGNNIGSHTLVESDVVKDIFPVDIDNDNDIDILYSTDSEIFCNINTDGKATSWEEKIIDDAFYNAIVCAAELDGDDYIDIVAVDIDNPEELKCWKHIDGLGNFNSGEVVNISNYGDEAGSLISADINNDGSNDLILAGVNDGDIVWLENDGNADFTKYSIDTYNHFNAGYSLFSADVDIDNDPDMICVTEAGGSYSIVWWENTTDGINIDWTEHIIDGDIGAVSRSVYSSDIDGDTDMDVLTALPDNGRIIIWFNDGDQNFSKQIIKNNSYGVRAVKTADMDADNDPDIITAADDLNDITWWENNLLNYGQ